MNNAQVSMIHDRVIQRKERQANYLNLKAIRQRRIEM